MKCSADVTHEEEMKNVHNILRETNWLVVLTCICIVLVSRACHNKLPQIRWPEIYCHSCGG